MEKRKNIIIENASEGNLQAVSLEIPREKLVVFTGLSGSGKSTLLVDVLMTECQRQYLEALGMQGIRKPRVERVRNLSPAVMIAQTDANRNPRSTVGTVTDIYTELRMIYEKLGVRKCPACGAVISAAECREETRKDGDDFRVYMYCSHCGARMDKLTRTDFSFNTREGACKTCEGLGRTLQVNRERTVQEALSPEDGAVDFWEQKYKEYQTENLYRAFDYYGIPAAPGTKVSSYSGLQKSILYDGVEADRIKASFPGKKTPETVAGGKFEGIVPGLLRRVAERKGEPGRWSRYFDFAACPDCGGERLAEPGRSATVKGKRLPEIAALSLEEIGGWIEAVEKELSEEERILVESYLLDVKTKVDRLVRVGIGYLSPDRQTVTLSGGEGQRLRLAAALDCELTGIIYIMDEPTAGLHPRDTAGLISIMEKLRDLGNTVLVIEHDKDVMRAADYIIDMGPGAGRHGGRIVGKGTLEELMRQNTSVTGRYFAQEQPDEKRDGEKRNGEKGAGEKRSREGNGESAGGLSGKFLRVRNADRHNLKNVDADFRAGCLTAVTGVSGSGKSTLVFDVLARELEQKREQEQEQKQELEQERKESSEEVGLAEEQDPARTNIVRDEVGFERIVTVEQTAVSRMKRSNVATYSEAYTEIRKLFANTEEAKEKKLSSRHFSFNTKGGRCENCEGLGVIMSHQLFFENLEVTCPVCQGKRFTEEVLSVKYKGYSIHDALRLSVEEALEVFAESPGLRHTLTLLKDAGLEYLELGQTLTTLSGGEGQRLKLAKELSAAVGRKEKSVLYLLDEPTRGMHPYDVKHFLALLDRIVDAGNTVIVVEHNEQVIAHCDDQLELGPEGGAKGGRIIHEEYGALHERSIG